MVNIESESLEEKKTTTELLMKNQIEYNLFDNQIQEKHLQISEEIKIQPSLSNET